MATGESENVPPVSVSLEITIARAVDRAQTASSMLDNAIEFISSSIESDSSFRPSPNSSCSFLISLHSLLEEVEDTLNGLNSTTTKATTNTGTMETGTGNSEIVPSIPPLDDPAIIKALIRLNTASSRIHQALHFIHPKTISPKPFYLNASTSLALIESLFRKVEEAISILTKRLEELTATESPSRWQRFKRSWSRFRKSIAAPFRSCIGRSGNTEN